MDSRIQKQLEDIFNATEAAGGAEAYLNAKNNKIEALKQTTPPDVDAQIDLFFSDFKTYFLDDAGRQERSSSEAYQKARLAPPLLSDLLLSHIREILLQSGDPLRGLQSLKTTLPDEVDVAIDHIWSAYQSSFANPAVTREEAVVRALKSPMTSFVSELEETSQKDQAAISHCNAFFADLSRRGVQLTGDFKTDKSIISTEWKNYQALHKKEPGLEEATELMTRWFKLAAQFPGAGIKIALKDGKIQMLGGLLFAGISLFLDAKYLLDDEWKADAPIVNLLLGDVNKELGGAIDVRKMFVALLGQIDATGIFVKPWLAQMKDDQQRLLARSVLFFVAAIGMIENISLNNELLNVSWSERPQFPEEGEEAGQFQKMVQELMSFLLDGSVGTRATLYSLVPSAGPGESTVNNISAILFRGASAALLLPDMWNSGRRIVYGEIHKDIIPDADPDYTTSFQTVSDDALGANMSNKGVVGVLNDALFMTDILMGSAEAIMTATSGKDGSQNKITPALAFAISTALYSLVIGKTLSDHPEYALDIEDDDIYGYVKDECADEEGGNYYLCGYLGKQNLEMNPEDFQSALNRAAVKTVGSIAAGSLEALAAGYANPKNQKAIIDAFARVNSMLGDNLKLIQTAGESMQRIINSNPEETSLKDISPDQYPAVTSTMKWMLPLVLDSLTSLWAGVEAGSVAAHYKKGEEGYLPAEYFPVTLGLVIRLGQLVSALTEPSGEGETDPVSAGYKHLVGMETLNLGLYSASAFISYLVSKWMQQPVSLGLTFTNGRYMMTANLTPQTAGLGLDGTFGPVSPFRIVLGEKTQKAEQDLEKAKKELADLWNGKTRIPEEVKWTDGSNWFAKKEEEIQLRIQSLEADLARYGVEMQMFPEDARRMEEIAGLEGVIQKRTRELHDLSSDPQGWLAKREEALNEDIRLVTESERPVSGEIKRSLPFWEEELKKIQDDPEAYLTAKHDEYTRSLFSLQAEAFERMGEQLAYERNALTQMGRGRIAYDKTNPIHRQILVERLKSHIDPLIARKDEIKKELETLEDQRREIDSLVGPSRRERAKQEMAEIDHQLAVVEEAPQMFTPDILLRLQERREALKPEIEGISLAIPDYLPTPKSPEEIALRGELDRLNRQLSGIFSGDNLDELYAEATGHRVSLSGMNPFLIDYQKALDSQSDNLLAMARLFTELARA